MADEEHGAAEPCEDNKFELLLQDRLRLVAVTLRAQLSKARETGFDVHSAKGLVSAEVAVWARLEARGVPH